MRKQNKVILTVLLCVVSIVAMCFAFAACNDSHEHTEETVVGKAATCTETGLTEGKKCSECGEILVEQEVIPALGHDLKDVAKVEATCTEAGHEAGKECSRCDYTEGLEEIEALGHDLTDVAKVEATCTEAGHEAGKECSRCDYTEGLEVIPALGHDLKDVAKVEATCTEAGHEAGKECSRCDYTEGLEEIEALGHDLTDVAKVEATCTEAGHEAGKECSRCDYTEGLEEIEAPGHSLDSWTDGGDGKHYQECSVCHEKLNESGHNLDTEASTSKDGHYYECLTCSYTTEVEEHFRGDNEYIQPTGNPLSVHYWRCSVCDYNVSEYHTNEKDYSDDDVVYEVCTLCGYRTYHHTHKKVYTSNDDGTHTVTCNDSFASNCPYSKTVACNITTWTPLEDAATGHTGTCDNCGYTIALEAHDTDGYNGGCSKCGYIDYGDHTHTDNPDANGYYDGICDECGGIYEDSDGNPVWTFSDGTISAYTGTATKISMPSEINGVTVTGFGNRVFYKNTAITDVIIPSSITTFPTTAFSGCNSLKTAIILADVTKLPSSSFTDCTSLDWIVLSATITEINTNAFGGSTTKTTLSAIYYLGDDWSKVTVGVNANTVITNNSAKIYTYSSESKENGWHWQAEDVLIPQPWSDDE